MSTTQRSESIHAFFDGFVHHSTTLEQFVNQYNNALRDRAEKVIQADFQSSNSTMSYNTKSPIERQFQAIYTHAKLKEVQEDSVCTYKVVEDMIIRDKTKEVEFTVMFNKDNHDMKWKCLLFEFRGIVCRHSLVVLGIERTKEMPSKYVLLRWSKNIKRRRIYIKSSYDVKQLKLQMQRFDDICKDFYEVGEIAAEYEDKTGFLHKSL